jgi:fused signal recognition particle receptor
MISNFFLCFSLLLQKNMGLFSFFKKSSEQSMVIGLEKTKKNVFKRLWDAISGKKEIDEELLAELEEILLSADVGVKTTVQLLSAFEEKARKEKFASEEELMRIFEDVVLEMLLKYNTPEKIQSYDESIKPFVYLIVGVNGVGKTTTIGKLAGQFKQAGKKVLLGAADTFRAAAVDQLKVWANRAGVDIHEKGMGADPGAVAYETLSKAKAGDYDVVIIDTAGRLHNKVNLMNELGKIRRVMSKVIETAPHEVLLVLDATTGQNAFEQARQFTEVTKVTGLVLTKLDGTAKGGVVLGVSNEFQLPIKFVGLGENIDDLQVFDPEVFVKVLLKNVE